MKKIYAFLPALICLACSCSFPAQHPRTTMENEGRAVLYLQPPHEEGRRIRFAIDGVTAVQENGSEVPLSLFFKELIGSEPASGQKFLASGFLREGRYRGISVKVGRAFLVRQDGDAALLIPEGPVLVRNSFEVKRKGTVPLFLTFSPSQSLSEGIRFDPAFSLASSSRGLAELTGYVTNPDADGVTVFDKKRMQVSGIIGTAAIPRGIVLDQGGRKAYVAVSGGNMVDILDVFSGERIGRIPLSGGDEPRELGISPDGRTLVSANYGTGTASIIDTVSRIETRRVKVGEGPVGVLVDRRGLRAYVMNSLSNTISVIDLIQKQSLANVAVEGFPLKADFSRAGDKLYVIGKYSPDLTIIDPVLLSWVGRVFIGTGAVSIKVDTQTDLIFVGNETTGEITILDPFSQSAIDRIDVRGTPSLMTIDREEGMLLVVNPDRRKIQKINLVSREIVAEMEIGGEAHGIVVMGER